MEKWKSGKVGPLPADLADALLLTSARIGPIAGRIIWFSDIGSTNDVANVLAERGAEEGTVVAADVQHAGRGRRGRDWASPAGAGIYASVVLRPHPRIAPLLTIAAGVAIGDGIAAATGLQVQLKWPNDVYADGRKLAGILAESSGSHVVLGFGINVLPAAYPPDVAARATSIEREVGRPVDRGLVLAECLAALWTRRTQLMVGESATVLNDWRARAAATFGRSVEWERDGTVERGVVEGIDDAGALVVRAAAATTTIIAGEVRWV